MRSKKLFDKIELPIAKRMLVMQNTHDLFQQKLIKGVNVENNFHHVRLNELLNFVDNQKYYINWKQINRKQAKKIYNYIIYLQKEIKRKGLILYMFLKENNFLIDGYNFSSCSKFNEDSRVLDWYPNKDFRKSFNINNWG